MLEEIRRLRVKQVIENENFEEQLQDIKKQIAELSLPIAKENQIFNYLEGDFKKKSFTIEEVAHDLGCDDLRKNNKILFSLFDGKLSKLELKRYDNIEEKKNVIGVSQISEEDRRNMIVLSTLHSIAKERQKDKIEKRNEECCLDR